MGLLIGRAISLALNILAGIGIGEIADKVLPDKVPGYEPVSPIQSKSPRHLLIFVVVFVAGGLLARWLIKKVGLSSKIK